ncbi:PTS fructose transporter subunit IID [Escherichia coli]|nr:PTS fructose transporter subunit IID [Escherichia coli]
MSDDVMQHELVERARESGALTKADITKAWFIYWLGAEVSSSYERLQSLIFCASMTPIIKKLYPQKEEQVEALKRHLNFFNSEQTFGAVIQGISIAMEEQKTRGEAINDASITGIKTGLMGAAGRDGRLHHLGGGDAAVDCYFYPVRRQWQRDGRYFAADSLPGDYAGNQLRHGAQGLYAGARFDYQSAAGRAHQGAYLRR